MDQVIEKLQNADTIMEVTDLCKFFKAGRKQILKAVDHVSVSIKRGETLGLVGESGCGKNATDPHPKYSLIWPISVTRGPCSLA